MPAQDPTPLTLAERDRVRILLEEQLTDLETREAQLVESSTPPDLESPIGRLSRMDALQNQEMSKAGLGRLRHRLDRTRRALRRIDDPHFGTCGSCGNSIGIDRLEFEPESTRCVRCA